MTQNIPTPGDSTCLLDFNKYTFAYDKTQAQNHLQEASMKDEKSNLHKTDTNRFNSTRKPFQNKEQAGRPPHQACSEVNKVTSIPPKSTGDFKESPKNEVQMNSLSGVPSEKGQEVKLSTQSQQVEQRKKSEADGMQHYLMSITEWETQRFRDQIVLWMIELTEKLRDIRTDIDVIKSFIQKGTEDLVRDVVLREVINAKEDEESFREKIRKEMNEKFEQEVKKMENMYRNMVRSQNCHHECETRKAEEIVGHSLRRRVENTSNENENHLNKKYALIKETRNNEKLRQNTPGVTYFDDTENMNCSVVRSSNKINVVNRALHEGDRMCSNYIKMSASIPSTDKTENMNDNIYVLESENRDPGNDNRNGGYFRENLPIKSNSEAVKNIHNSTAGKTVDLRYAERYNQSVLNEYAREETYNVNAIYAVNKMDTVSTSSELAKVNRQPIKEGNSMADHLREKWHRTLTEPSLSSRNKDMPNGSKPYRPFVNCSKRKEFSNVMKFGYSDQNSVKRTKSEIMNKKTPSQSALYRQAMQELSQTRKPYQRAAWH